MEKEVKLLEVVDGETLMDMQFPKSRFCIQSLLPQGVSILGGAPNPVPTMPQEMIDFIEFMKVQKYFNGSNTDLVDSFNSVKGYSLTAKSLKQMMNKFRYDLEDSGVQFTSHRSNGQRLVEVSYLPVSDSSAVSGEESESVKTSVPFVPCDPVGEILADKRRIG